MSQLPLIISNVVLLFFIDLAKAFDRVDHYILVGRLRSIGVSEGSLAWFANYLSKSAVFEVRTSAVSGYSLGDR